MSTHRIIDFVLYRTGIHITLLHLFQCYSFFRSELFVDYLYMISLIHENYISILIGALRIKKEDKKDVDQIPRLFISSLSSIYSTRAPTIGDTSPNSFANSVNVSLPKISVIGNTLQPNACNTNILISDKELEYDFVSNVFTTISSISFTSFF